jgi:hypothetical protein
VASSGSGPMACDPFGCLTMCFPTGQCGQCSANGCMCIPFDPS